jgi:prolyl oligopeptidase
MPRQTLLRALILRAVPAAAGMFVFASTGLYAQGSPLRSRPAPAPLPVLHYPPARRDATVDDYSGIRVPAPYQWMENLQSPALHRWVRAENALTDAYLARIAVRPWIRARLTHLWNYPREHTPVQVAGGRIFFRRNSGLQNQAVLYVQDPRAAAARVLIDPNELSPDGSVALADYAPSPDGRYVAYALSAGGSDWETLHVLDVRTGRTLSDAVRWVKFSDIAWTNDDGGFYYSRYPKPAGNNRINQPVLDQMLYYHRLGRPQGADVLVYRRPDLPRWNIDAEVSEDGRYLFITLQNGDAPRNELYFSDLRDPHHPDIPASIRPLFVRNDAQYSVVGEDQGTLYLRTTLQAPRQRIVAAALSDPAPGRWRSVVPEGSGVIEYAALAGGQLIVQWQSVGVSRLLLYSTAGRVVGELGLPTLGSVVGLSARADSDSIYYAFTSFLSPTSIYRYSVHSRRIEVVFRPPSRFDAADYETRQVFYRSRDGTRVPMFIVAKKHLKLDGSHPAILYGYGGFDITLTPTFDPMLPVWLELGGVYAVPNLRGGAVHGESWHRAGMLGNKQNVFDDFAWAAMYLISHGYTSSSRLGIQGYSNGGLLTGASITQRPNLFGAAYVGHGVLDMLRYQDFSGGALWAPEYGASSDPQALRWLLAYSPLQNIHADTCYPPTLITTSWDDDRVVPMHEFKFAARMQHAQACSHPILLLTSGATSHIYMPTDKEIRQTADVWSFEAYNLGIVHVPDSPAGGAPRSAVR